MQIWGAGDYAMRVWLDPGKVAERGLTASEVVKAIREQNVQVAAGVIGAPPNDRRTPLQLNVNAQGRLKDEAEFAQIILKTAPDGGVTRLGDVARIELAAAEYGLRALLDNKPAVAIPIFQTPGANALDISTQVRETMAELEKDFPPSVKYSIVYDPTQFVRASIKAVITTLLEAIALVVLVVIVFLQTWRASIIPLLAVPVSIIGTFSLMLGFGYSINALSLFGMVLAIGIVVDDAIVVVENVERNIEAGLSPHEATYRAMREVSGPIIAIALTLVAVFVPLAFMTGLTGQFYKQFAMTIAISTVISAFNSLTLSPALAALLLKGHDEVRGAPDPLVAAKMALLRVLHAADMPDPGALVKKLEDLAAQGGTAFAAPVGAGGGAASAAAPAPTPVAQDWKALIERVDQSGQLRVAQVMHDWVRVIELKPGELIYAPAPGYSGDLGAELRDALLRATGERWQVTRAEGDARPTLREEAEAAKSAAKAAMLRSPLVEATLAAFPGAELLDEQAEAQIHGRDGQNWRNRA